MASTIAWLNASIILASVVGSSSYMHAVAASDLHPLHKQNEITICRRLSAVGSESVDTVAEELEEMKG